MISSEIESALNAQLNRETASAYLYLSMSAYFESIDFPGFASWMRAQAKEEMAHAMKYYTFLVDRSGKIELGALAAPTSTFTSPLQAFEMALGHERMVTVEINKLVDLSISKSDHATQYFLQWFVSEQVEEEATAQSIVSRLKRIGDNVPGLVLLDQELGRRSEG